MKKMTVLMLAMTLMAGLACAEEIAIGAKAPAFSLVNARDGATVAMKPDDGNTKVVIFSCNQCPFAKAFEPRIVDIARKFQQQGVRFYVVDSNDASGETLADMKGRADEKDYPFPYLKDADSSIAHAYGARVTPHVFVVDGQGNVRYRGNVDDSAKPAERKTTGLTDALGALLNGRDVATTDTRAFGCTIKWKS
ncbi:MAG: thioredoxin family protein [Acidobacteriota bacterium]